MNPQQAQDKLEDLEKRLKTIEVLIEKSKLPSGYADLQKNVEGETKDV